MVNMSRRTSDDSIDAIFTVQEKGKEYFSMQIPIDIIYNKKTKQYRIFLERDDDDDGLVNKPFSVKYESGFDSQTKRGVSKIIEGHLREKIKETSEQDFDGISCRIPEFSDEEFPITEGDYRFADNITKQYDNRVGYDNKISKYLGEKRFNPECSGNSP